MPFPISGKSSDDSGIYADTKTIEGVSGPEIRPQSHDTSPVVRFSDEKIPIKIEYSEPRSTPRLAPPELSTINFIALLKDLQRSNSDADTKMAMINGHQIESELDIRKANEIENNAKLQAQQAKMDETAASKKALNWVLGIVGLIVAVIAVAIAGAALSVATGGAAAPAVVALVGAVFGGIMSAMNVANLAVQEAKVTRLNAFGETVPVEISFSGIAALADEAKVTTGETRVIGVNATYDTPGAITRKEYEERKEQKSFVLNVCIAGVMLVLCLASIGSAVMAGRAAAQAGATIIEKTTEVAAEATRELSQTATRVQYIASAVSTGATLLTAVGSGVNAYFSIVLGDTKKERSETLIIEKTIEAAIQALQQQFDASQQNFQSAMNFQETLRSNIANTMADYFESSTSIVRNIKV